MKNICRAHGPLAVDQDAKDALNNFTQCLTKWVQHLGKERANSCTCFALLRPRVAREVVVPEGSPASYPDGDCQIVLLARPTYSPLMQFYILYQLADGRCFFKEPPAPPFRVHMQSGDLRMAPGSPSKGMMSKTSDELCHTLLQRNPGLWEIVPLKSLMACDVEALTDEIVEGMEDPFVMQVRKVVPSDKMSALDLGDPCEEGFVQEALGDMEPKFVPSGGGSGAHDAGEPLDGLPELDPTYWFLSSDDDEPPLREVDVDVDGPPVSVEGSDAPPVREEDDDEALAIPGMADWIRDSIVSPETGQITCVWPPWAHIPRLGYFRFVNSEAPPQQRRIKLVCWLHPSCSVFGPAFNAAGAPNEPEFLEWLYSGTPWTQYKDAAPFRDLHQAIWRDRERG